jgi:nucleotide-binding universal stress UspA family protein
MFKSILFPTDGSPASLAAAKRLAGLLTGSAGAKVTLAAAFTPVDPEESDYEPDVAAKHNTFLRKQAGDYLSAAAKVFEELGIGTGYRILEGRPISAAIAREAERGGYDAVVMGSRGLGMEEGGDNYLGSVTEHVIRRVSTPVLVIPLRTR